MALVLIMFQLILPIIRPIWVTFGLEIAKIPSEPYKAEPMPFQLFLPNYASKFTKGAQRNAKERKSNFVCLLGNLVTKEIQNW